MKVRPAAGQQFVVAVTHCQLSAENCGSASHRQDPTADWRMSAAHREMTASLSASPQWLSDAAPASAATYIHNAKIVHFDIKAKTSKITVDATKYVIR